MKYWPLTTAGCDALAGGDVGNTQEVTRRIVFEECEDAALLPSSHRSCPGDHATGVGLPGRQVFLCPLQICHLPSVGILWLMLGMTKPLVLEMHFPLARAPPNEVLPPCGTKARIRRPAGGRKLCCGNTWKRRPGRSQVRLCPGICAGEVALQVKATQLFGEGAGSVWGRSLFPTRLVSLFVWVDTISFSSFVNGRDAMMVN